MSRHGSRRRAVLAIPIILFTVLGAVSCTSNNSHTPAADNAVQTGNPDHRIISDPALTSEWQAKNFEPHYTQNIKWRECTPQDQFTPEVSDAFEAAGINNKEVKCGSITAPLDWTDPENLQSAEIAVVYIPSTGENPKGTMLGNPGGPGATGRDYMMGMAVAPGFDKVLSEYNLLGFDPRGIGASQPINCKDSKYTTSSLQIGECVGNNPLTHYMGTSSVARDMDLMRSLMNDEKLNYLGVSYGTMLGATYATLFQDKVGRMVLDSAEDAGWASPIHRFDQQVAISRAIVQLGQTCEAEYIADGSVEECPFVTEESIKALVERLNAEPLQGAEGAQLTGDNVFSFLTSILYQTPVYRKTSIQALSLALKGDADAVKIIADITSTGGAGVDSAGTIVTCHSFPNDPNIPGLLEHVNRIGVPVLLGGPEVDEQTLSQLADLGCFALPESGYDISTKFSAPDAPPILIIGITGDHATPYQYAEELSKQLESSTLLTVDGQGHAASYQGRSSCVDTAVTNYFIDGTMPEPGTICHDDAPAEEAAAEDPAAEQTEELAP